MYSSLFNDYNVTFIHQDFPEILNQIEDVDQNVVVYLDPPYINTFDDYCAKRFDYPEFEQFLQELTKKYVHTIMSNSVQYEEKVREMDIFETIERYSAQERANAYNGNTKRTEILCY